MRTLTLRELNRATLARQLLLARRPLSVAKALERTGGLQAQWPPSPYLGLWSRVEGFRADDLVRAVTRRRVVKATLMRATLHLVSARDYLAYAGLYRARRIAELERQLSALGEEADFATDGERIAELAREQPRSRPELLALLGRPKLELENRRPWLVWFGLAAHAGLVCAPSSSVWRSHTAGATFVPARSWLGADGADGELAAAQLVRRYLAAFGPASRADLAQWTGLPLAFSSRASSSSSSAASPTKPGGRFSTSRARRSPTRAFPLRSASCRAGTASCSPTTSVRACCPRSTGRS